MNNRIQAAVPRLPEEVRRQGIVVRKASTNILQIVAMYSPDGSQDPLALTNYASLNILDEIRRVPGVGDAQMWGQEYSIRIWMQPDKLVAARPRCFRRDRRGARSRTRSSPAAASASSR